MDSPWEVPGLALECTNVAKGTKQRDKNTQRAAVLADKDNLA